MSVNTRYVHMLHLPWLCKCKINNQPDGCSSPLCATVCSALHVSSLIQVDPIALLETSVVIQTVVTKIPHKHAADSAVALYGSR